MTALEVLAGERASPDPNTKETSTNPNPSTNPNTDPNTDPNPNPCSSRSRASRPRARGAPPASSPPALPTGRRPTLSLLRTLSMSRTLTRLTRRTGMALLTLLTICWKAAPSSHTSHWSTIGAQHSDPNPDPRPDSNPNPNPDPDPKPNQALKRGRSWHEGPGGWR